MEHKFGFVGLILALCLMTWAVRDGGISGEAENCVLRWGEWNDEASKAQVWFGCEDAVFERRFQSFERDLSAGWQVDSITHHPPSDGYRRGTTVYISSH